MPAGPKIWRESTIRKRNRQGLGTGDGSTYQPAIRVQEFSSRAPQTRMGSSLRGRTVHLHSGLERALYLILEFSTDIVEFKEQVPMDRSITLGAAQTLGIKHPVHDRTNVPVVMTLDVLVTERDAAGVVTTTAWDVKPWSELSNERALEKLSLHRAYALRMGLTHRLFTERSCSKAYIENIDWLWCSRRKDAELLSTPDFYERYPRLLLEELAAGARRTSIRDFCSCFDVRHRLKPGSALRLFKQLVWSHNIRIDLSTEERELQDVPRPTHVTFIGRNGKHVQ